MPFLTYLTKSLALARGLKLALGNQSGINQPAIWVPCPACKSHTLSPSWLSSSKSSLLPKSSSFSNSNLSRKIDGHGNDDLPPCTNVQLHPHPLHTLPLNNPPHPLGRPSLLGSTNITLLYPPSSTPTPGTSTSKFTCRLSPLSSSSSSSSTLAAPHTNGLNSTTPSTPSISNRFRESFQNDHPTCCSVKLSVILAQSIGGNRCPSPLHMNPTPTLTNLSLMFDVSLPPIMYHPPYLFHGKLNLLI